MTAKVISVSSNKGGVLKTSMVTNIAGVLASKGKRVLIIDTDSQSNVALTFGHNPDEFESMFKCTLYDLLTDEEGTWDAREAIYNLDHNLDAIATDDRMIQFEFNVLIGIDRYTNEPIGQFKLLKRVIEPLKEHYDFIILDTPPNLGLMQGNILMATDEIIIPYQPEVYAMRSLMKTLDMFNQFKEDFNHNLEIIGVVPTMVRANTMIHRNLLSILKAHSQVYGYKIARNHIPNSIQYPATVSAENGPITITRPKTKLAKVYVDLVKELGILEVNNNGKENERIGRKEERIDSN